METGPVVFYAGNGESRLGSLYCNLIKKKFTDESAGTLFLHIKPTDGGWKQKSNETENEIFPQKNHVLAIYR